MKERIDPWTLQGAVDYQGLLDEFGMEPMQAYSVTHDDLRYIRRSVVFGHRDFGRIAEAMQKRKPYAMMTGLMPSGKFHFGHKMVADEIIWLQEHGAEVFICAADLESYAMRDIPLAAARETAVKEYLENYLALGLSPKNVNFWFQTDYRIEYYRLRDMFAKKVTFNELKAIYGELSPGKIFSVLTQAADILHPQLPEFGGPRPVVVPVGADQDPHIRLTRDIASRFEGEFHFIPPSATFHKFMDGLQGGKMSSSDSKSYIALTDAPDEAAKKIMGAKTGGRATVEEQKRKGGIPEECMIYAMYLYHLIDDDLTLSDIYHECRKGTLLCGEDKKRCAEMVARFLEEHQKRKEKASAKAEKLAGR